jgi:hypothetical protein
VRRIQWTIRARLAVGFGLTVLALFLAGVVAVRSLGSVQENARRYVGQVAETGNRLFLTHDATLRLVALAQAELMGTERLQAAAMDSLTAVSDSLRWLLVTQSGLGTGERTRLEQMGAYQGRIEVRLAVARAYRDLGRIDDAFRQAGLATRALDSLLAHAAAINQGQEERAAAALTRIDRAVTLRRLAVWALLIGGAAFALWFGSSRPRARSAAATCGSRSRGKDSIGSTRSSRRRSVTRPRGCASCSRTSRRRRKGSRRRRPR